MIDYQKHPMSKTGYKPEGYMHVQIEKAGRWNRRHQSSLTESDIKEIFADYDKVYARLGNKNNSLIEVGKNHNVTKRTMENLLRAR